MLALSSSTSGGRWAYPICGLDAMGLMLFLKFPAQFQAMLLLFILQQSWHKLRHNPPHVASSDKIR
jgi:hypothetical protein